MSETRVAYRTAPVSRRAVEPWRVQFTVYGIAPSGNSLYPMGNDGRRHISQEGRDWHDLVSATAMIDRVQPAPSKRTHMAISLEVVGLSYRRDLDNTLKLTVDALAACLAFDDRWVDVITAKRVPAEREGQRETRIWMQEVEVS